MKPVRQQTKPEDERAHRSRKQATCDHGIAGIHLGGDVDGGLSGFKLFPRLPRRSAGEGGGGVRARRVDFTPRSSQLGRVKLQLRRRVDGLAAEESARWFDTLVRSETGAC